MRKQLEFHDKQNNKLFDYHIEDRNGLKTYVFMVDGKEKYRDKEPLTDEELSRFIAYYSL